MVSVFSILLSSFILLQSINLQLVDLMEMDELMEHYQFHKDEYDDSFIVFVSKHYGELKSEHSQKHKEEQKDHEKLPFQHQNQAPQLVVLLFSTKLISTLTSEGTDLHSVSFHYQNSYSFDWSEGPFQPPKHS